MIIKERKYVHVPVGLIQSENLCWQAKLLALNLLALDSGDYEAVVLAQRTGLMEEEVAAAAEQLVKAGYMDRTAYGFYFKEAAVWPRESQNPAKEPGRSRSNSGPHRKKRS